ncbi:hypothetical protein L1987_69480 [Smallanthus sonchifolius]|uniref:Uncharacterized protein n=1 Tax=Smallanthus sonchifolius TaxID=185202 RepID=A0ACB9B6J4_9ASTR|nr:hypothetical protein L1987_69480 [Smallanthus sonchifolius]
MKPLRYALGHAVKLKDQVVVLVIFNSDYQSQSPVMSASCCIGTDGRKHQPSERERYIQILKEEISKGTEDYMKIFKPFYKECKSIRVKFEVKIVVGSTIDAIVSEEKNNTGASSIIIGRSLSLKPLIIFIPCFRGVYAKFIHAQYLHVNSMHAHKASPSALI